MGIALALRALRALGAATAGLALAAGVARGALAGLGTVVVLTRTRR